MPKLFINPLGILKKIDLKKGTRVADFGCGAGAWAIPAGKIVGNSGKIYALDILEYMLEITANKAQKENLKNIETIKADIERPLDENKIKPHSCDLVIISNILFQVGNKEKILENAQKLIKKDGRVLVVDWQKDSLFGPEKKLRVSKEKVKRLAKEKGMILAKEIDAGYFHYGLLFKNK